MPADHIFDHFVTLMKDDDLRVYRHISHGDIEEVLLASLTVLRFPRYLMHDASFHMLDLLALAEAIDVINLASMVVDHVDNARIA